MKNLSAKITAYLILFPAMAFTTFAQSSDVQSALKGIGDFYKKQDHVYHEVAYKMYTDPQTTVPHSSEEGLLIIGAGVKYSKIASIESLVTKDYIIGIDHEERTLMIANYIAGISVDPLENLQNYLQQLSAAYLNSASSEINQLTLEMDRGEISQTRIFFRKDNFQPEKIVLWYRQEIQLEGDEHWYKPRMEIIYSNTDLKDKGKSFLNINNYLSRSDRYWKPTGKYADFELINNIHENPFNQ